MEYYRTDLAMDAKENFEKDNVEIKGVRLERKEGSIPVTTVQVETPEGARQMHKPIGTYITIEIPDREEKEEKVVKAICGSIKKLQGKKRWDRVLVVGLGNRDITPDRVGPETIKYIDVSSHILAIAPGVLAQTGMETGNIIFALVEQEQPDVVIAVDALATSSVERLVTTIQMTDTGIHPGAGVGNNRQVLDKKNLGRDVIAIGVPTVVDALTIVADSLDKIGGKPLLEYLEQDPFSSLYVTPGNIDEAVFRMSNYISRAINETFGMEA